MTNSANLPAPFGGINKKIPIAALKSPFCESLLNFNTTEAGVELRKGDSTWSAVANTAPATTDTFLGFVQYGDTNLFYCAQPNAGFSRYFSITSGTASAVHTSTTNINGEIFATYYMQRVYTFYGGADGDYYDGTAWGAWGYTGLTAPIGGCTYKNRLYLINGNSTAAAYGYTGIDSVTGATTSVDLSGVILQKSSLAIIAPVTIANAGQTLQLLAFVMFSGEVLFYSGSYPNSDSWGLAGRGKIGKPLNFNSFIDYQGDALVLTRIGLSSLRDVYLSGGQQASTKTVSDPIDPDWITMINAVVAQTPAFYSVTTGRIKWVTAAWWQSKNRIVISLPFYLNTSGTVTSGATYFVFDTLRGGWTRHRSYGATRNEAIVEFRDNLLFCGYSVGSASEYLLIQNKEAATDFQDTTGNGTSKSSYDFEMLSAPVPFPKTAVYEATQIEPILESDLYAETNYNFVVDFGRQTSGDQPTDAATTSVAKPAVNVGMQNITYVQVKMSGTTAASKTVGLNLYSYNVWYSSGEKASR